jgi:Domain of unknown function (DUF1707)
MEEPTVDDRQRDAAVAHLVAEHAGGVLDPAELARRTASVRAAQTVAELLAATADPAVEALGPSPAAHLNRLALGAGVLVAVVLLLVLLPALT